MLINTNVWPNFINKWHEKGCYQSLKWMQPFQHYLRQQTLNYRRGQIVSFNIMFELYQLIALCSHCIVINLDQNWLLQNHRLLRVYFKRHLIIKAILFQNTWFNLLIVRIKFMYVIRLNSKKKSNLSCSPSYQSWIWLRDPICPFKSVSLCQLLKETKIHDVKTQKILSPFSDDILGTKMNQLIKQIWQITSDCITHHLLPVI